jgi:hypothetical protein
MVVPTGHHTTGDDHLKGGEGEFYISDIPEGTNAVIYSACSTLPKIPSDDGGAYTGGTLGLDESSYGSAEARDIYNTEVDEQNAAFDEYIEQYPDDVTMIGGYPLKTTAPLVDDNAVYATSPDAMNILKTEGEEAYIQSVLSQVKDNAINSAGRLGLWGIISYETAGQHLGAQMPNHYMSFLHKKETSPGVREWHVYTPDNPEGQPAHRSRIASLTDT